MHLCVVLIIMALGALLYMVFVEEGTEMNNQIKQDIDWEPYFDLKGGLQNSFDNDFKLKSNSSFDPNLDNILFNS